MTRIKKRSSHQLQIHQSQPAGLLYYSPVRKQVEQAPPAPRPANLASGFVSVCLSHCVFTLFGVCVASPSAAALLWSVAAGS